MTKEDHIKAAKAALHFLGPEEVLVLVEKETETRLVLAANTWSVKKWTLIRERLAGLNAWIAFDKQRGL